MKLKEVFMIFAETMLIVGITLAGVIPFSCKVTTEGIQIIGGDYRAPVIEKVEVINEKKVVMGFSDSVKVREIVVSPRLTGLSDSDKHSITEALSPAIGAASGLYGKIESQLFLSDEGKVLTLNLMEETTIGKGYEIFGTVEDRIGSSLTFCIPFVGFNSKAPKLIITEAHVASGDDKTKAKLGYLGEYVEVMALEEGNLAGLELMGANYGEKEKYVFPPVEVKAGEVLVVHLQKKEESCVSEEGDDLDLATAAYTRPGVRDLWAATDSGKLGNSADIVLLINTIDDSIVDAFEYATEKTEAWNKTVAEWAAAVAEAGIYESDDVTAAFRFKSCGSTKAMVRKNAMEVLEAAQNDDEFVFPVTADNEGWEVGSPNPGKI